jgi:hypothetical protein
MQQSNRTLSGFLKDDPTAAAAVAAAAELNAIKRKAKWDQIA